jgi:hypothetical protein
MTMHAVVELMGHRTRAGAISDAQMGGATLLRIEHPSRADHTGAGQLTEYYAPSAIFSIRPCSAEEAAVVAGWAWGEQVSRPALGPAFAEMVEADRCDECSDGRHSDCTEVEDGSCCCPPGDDRHYFDVVCTCIEASADHEPGCQLYMAEEPF